MNQQIDVHFNYSFISPVDLLCSLIRCTSAEISRCPIAFTSLLTFSDGVGNNVAAAGREERRCTPLRGRIYAAAMELVERVRCALQ